MRAVVTVTGKDKKGIIANVSKLLAEYNVNIEDISQTILSDYFAMIMIADLGQCLLSITELAKKCEEEGNKIGMAIRVQHEDIFNAMHTI